MPFKIKEYEKDFDGSAIVTLDNINDDFESTGWEPTNIGLYSFCGFVVSEDEYNKLIKQKGK